MDSTTMIRVIAGVLAVVVLGIIIWRRKRQSID
jgi:LPXTG-motif cell wall-anchored protein